MTAHLIRPAVRPGHTQPALEDITVTDTVTYRPAAKLREGDFIAKADGTFHEITSLVQVHSPMQFAMVTLADGFEVSIPHTHEVNWRPASHQPANEDRTARDDLYVIAADHYRDGEEADALINQHTADVQRARDEQFAAWLGQKAREFPTDRSRQESTPDYLARLADKVRRGAIRRPARSTAAPERGGGGRPPITPPPAPARQPKEEPVTDETTPTLTPELEAKIRERATDATPGPWGTYDDGTGRYDIAADLEDTGHGFRCRRQIVQTLDEPIDNDPAHRDWTGENDDDQILADVEFIAHAREDVPVLLAEVDRLRARIAEQGARAHRELAPAAEPKQPPMDPVHILGIAPDAATA